MPNKYNDIPSTLKHDTNGLPSKEELAQVTHFVLGDEKNWGWLSSESENRDSSARLPKSFTYFGSRVMGVQPIRDAFSDVHVKRSNNWWHGQNEYVIHAGSWSPHRNWDDCANTDGPDNKNREKNVFGLKVFFDFVQSNRIQLVEKDYYYGGGIGACGAGGHSTSLYPEYPTEIIASDYTSGKSLGDKDNKVTISITSSANKFWDNLAGLKSFDGVTHTYDARVMMSQTAYALGQSRDMIDHFARRRLAKQNNPKLTDDKLEDAARTISTGDKKLLDMSFEYRNAITHVKDKLKAFHNFDAFIRQQPEGSVNREVAEQMFEEYNTILDAIPKEERNKQFIKQDKLVSDVMMKMMDNDDTAKCFTAGSTKGSTKNPINTGWFFTAKLSGLDYDKVEELLTPNNQSALKANTLIAELRFDAANMDGLSTQALFSADEAGANRSEMDIRILDITAMSRTMLNPEQAACENKERAYYLSAAHQGASVKPLTDPAKKNAAVRQLCTTLAASNVAVTPDTLDKVKEHLQRGTYSPEMQALKLTLTDVQEIRTLLKSQRNPDALNSQIEGLINGLKDIVDKQGSKGVLNYKQLAQVGANVSIQNKNSSVTYYVRDGRGNLHPVGTPIPDKHPAYKTAVAHSKTFNEMQRMVNDTADTIAVLGPLKQNPENPVFLTATFERQNTGHPLHILSKGSENPVTAKKPLGQVSPFTQIATFLNLLATRQ